MEDKPSSTNGTEAASSKKEQITEIAMTLLAQGRRHLLVADIPSAIAALAESTQLLAEQYGDQAEECGESYYYYGMALLEMARTDSDVLGDAVEGDKGEGGSSEDEDENGEEDGEESEDEEEDEEHVNGVDKVVNTSKDQSEDVEMKEEESSVEEKPKKLNGEDKPAETKAEDKPAVAKIEDKPSKAKTEDKPAEVKSEDKPAEAKAEDKPAEAKTEDKPAEAKTEDKPAEAKTEDKQTEAKAEDKSAEEKPGETKVDEKSEGSSSTEVKRGETAAESNAEEMETDSKVESVEANKECSPSAKVSKPKNEAKGKTLKAAGSSVSEAQTENGTEEDTGDEVSNLQLAWEVFELAKNIFQRKAENDPSAKPRLADALIRLAEVAIESENYTSAIEDLQKCLEIQLASFPSDSRSLAETHYQLGVAYTFTTEFKEAVKSFEAAADVIKLRIENLKNPVEKKPSMEEPKNLFHTIEGEIEELESLLPDIREKISDTIDLEKEAVRKLAENVSNGAGPSSISDAEAGASSVINGSKSLSESPNANKPALDITHLIRKKRKPEEGTEAETEASAPKKVCAEPVADVAS